MQITVNIRNPIGNKKRIYVMEGDTPRERNRTEDKRTLYAK